MNGFQNITTYTGNDTNLIDSYLSKVCHTGKRVRIFYGDTNRPNFEKIHGRKPDAGLDWNEEYDVTGYVGRSTGSKPIYILLANSTSNGGGAISSDCIVRLIVDGHEIYRHPNYHNKYDSAMIVPSELPEYSHAVLIPGDREVARFHSEKSAKRWLDFMNGRRAGK